MKLEVHSKLAAALMAACLVPALAFSQSVVPDAPDNQAGPAGPPTTVTVHGPEGPGMDMRMDVDVRRGPGMGMEMGPDMGMGRGMGMGMGMHRGGGHEMGLEWAINNPRLREQLLITPEQVEKIRQESLNFRKAEILSRADLEVKRLELDSLLEAETPDRAAIEKSLRAANAAQFVLEKAQIDHQLATRALLTLEQRHKLEKMREEGPRHFAGPGGPGGIMHPGENVFFYRRDGGGMMHPGGDVMYMRAPRVEKRVIVRSDEATATVPAPPQPPPPPQPQQ